MIKQKVIFTEDECNQIIQLSKNNYTNWDFKDRKYRSYSINYNENTEWLFNKLKSFFESETNERIKNIKKTIHFHVFLNGSWFDVHNDVRDNRVFGVGVLLNDNFKGGDFKFYGENNITLDKIQGNTYIFNVEINHEIAPIIEGTRYSILWFLQRENLHTNYNSLL